MKETFKQLFYLIRHFDDVVYELLVMIENRLREAVEDREG